MCFTYPGLSTLQGGVATVHAGGLQGSAVRGSRFGDDVWSWAGWVTGVTTPRDLGGYQRKRKAASVLHISRAT